VEFKVHLVSCSKVCSLISDRFEGPKFTFFQLSTLGEVIIRYVHEREALWRVVVNATYGSRCAGCYSNDVHESYGVGL
jgi:hypothetical protein